MQKEELHRKINRKIKEQDGLALATMLKINNKRLKEKVSKIDLPKLLSPFDKVLNSFYSDNFGLLSENLALISEESYWMIPVFRKIILNCYNLAILENKEEEFSKILLNIYRNNQKCENKNFILLIINLLLNIYFSKKKFALFENLISVISPPNFISKESVIFYYFSGLNALMNDNFKQANEFLKKSFKYKFISKEAALPYFISILLINKKIKSNLLMKYDLNYDFIKSICKGKFNKTNLPLNKLSEFNLTRVCLIHLPNVSLRNLINNVYKIAAVNYRLPLHFLNIVFKCSIEEIISIVIRLIDLGYIKGYLSVNYECIVFSKVDPFPK